MSEFMKRIKYECYVTVEKARWCGNIQVYRCLELNEHFSENEIKILE